MRLHITRACLGALALGLAGCAHVPPDVAPLAQRDIGTSALPADIRLAREGWPEAQWWKNYRDPQLDQLIGGALAASPTLEVAAARIGTAQSALSRTRADAGIEIGAGAGANRQRYSANGLLPAPIGGAYYNEETLRVEARYNFDWWGRNKAQIAAAAGETNARRAEYAQAEQHLAAAIAHSYFTLQGGWARRAALLELIATQQALVQDKIKRAANGLNSGDAQRLAALDLADLKRQLARLDGDNLREREALRALTVSISGDALAGLAPRPLPGGPHALPARLGIELLARRPDLQAARWRVEASISRIDAARAAFYPDFNLSAAAGLDSISLGRLLQAGSRTLFIGPTLSLPLFDSARLDAQIDATRSARNVQVAEYNQAVLQAVADVAQDGATLQAMENQLAEQEKATASAQSLLRSAQARMERGLAERGAVLGARLALLRQQDTVLQLRQMQVQAEVALIHSLGGGYRAEAPLLTSHQDRP
ncbi:MAG: efflux transporter outer membrane subunit [Pseudomonadota bacterium]